MVYPANSYSNSKTNLLSISWTDLLPDILVSCLILIYFFILHHGLNLTDETFSILSKAQFAVIAFFAFIFARACNRNTLVSTIRLSLMASTVITILISSIFLHLPDPYFWDSVNTYARARMIVEGKGLFAYHERFSTMYYVLAIFQKLINQSSVISHGLFGIISLSSFGALALLVKRILSMRAALLSIAFSVSLPIFFDLSHWLCLDMFMFSLCMWSLLCFYYYLEERKKIFLFIAVITGFAGILVKQYGFLILPFFGGLLLIKSEKVTLLMLWQNIKGFTIKNKIMVIMSIVLIFSIFYYLFTNIWSLKNIGSGKPSWNTLTVIPFNIHLSLAEKINPIWCLFRDNLKQFVGSGLFGLLILSIVKTREGKEWAYHFLVLSLLFITLLPFRMISPNPHTMWIIFHELVLWIALIPFIMIGIFRLTGLIQLTFTRFHFVLFLNFLIPVLFFSLVGRIGPGAENKYYGLLDWRYPIFSYISVIILSLYTIESYLSLIAGRGLQFVKFFFFLFLGVIVTSNVLLSSNDIRYTSAYTLNQMKGVEKAIQIATKDNAPVMIHWPYHYPKSPAVYNYGPYQWKNNNIRLKSIWKAYKSSHGVAIFDSKNGSHFINLLKNRASFDSFGTNVLFVYPLRLYTRHRQSPTVYVLDLATKKTYDKLTGFRDDFNSANESDRWHGLSHVEFWGETSIRWSQEKEVSLIFDPLNPNELSQALKLTIRGHRFGYIKEQSITAFMNDVNLGTIEVAPQPKWNEFSWVIPPHSLRTDRTNILRFVFKEIMRPSDIPHLKSHDNRQLAFAFDWLEIQPVYEK